MDGGGGSSWVAAVILVTEREQPPLPTQAQSRSRPPTRHICPKVPPVRQKDFGALGGIKDVSACLCCSEGVELLVLKVLEEVMGEGWLVILRSTQFNWHQPPKHLIVKASRW